MKKVTVIVPFYNGIDLLRGCLDALQKQSYPPEDFEIVAVDNASTDDVSRLKADYPRVRWLFEKEPGGFHARNRAIRNTTGEIIAFTDADCVPSPIWLEEAVKALETSNATFIGGRIDYLNPQGRGLNIYELFEERFFLLTKVRYLVEKLGVFATANITTYRAAFDRAGLFDPRLMSFGDGEWAARATSKGEILRYSDSALVFHPRRSTFKAIFKKAKRIASDKVVLLRHRHGGVGWIIPDLYQYSIFNPRVHCQALRFPNLRGGRQRLHMIAIVEVLSLANTAEKIRVLLGGRPYRG